MAGKRVILGKGVLRRRLRRSDPITTKNATAEENEEMIQSEKTEDAVDESAVSDGLRWARVEASDTPNMVTKRTLGAWGRRVTMRV